MLIDDSFNHNQTLTKYPSLLSYSSFNDYDLTLDGIIIIIIFIKL